MRMIDDSRDQPVEQLWLYLTEAEAQQLLDALLGRDPAEAGDWHAHVESNHGAGKLLTIAVYDPSAVSGDGKVDAFLRTDVWE